MDWSQNQGQINQMYGMNSIPGMPTQSQSQYMMSPGSDAHMSMNSMDLQAQHHPGLMHNDNMYSMVI